MTTTTARFAELLKDAKQWDSRHKAMCHAQTEYLLTNFCFGDTLCVYVDPVTMQKWDVPQTVAGHLFTVCK